MLFSLSYTHFHVMLGSPLDRNKRHNIETTEIFDCNTLRIIVLFKAFVVFSLNKCYFFIIHTFSRDVSKSP